MATANLPIAKVMVLEDRAQVERQGPVELAAGRNVLRVEGVSTLVVDRSLRAQVAGAKVVEARVLRTFKAVPPGGLPADASKLRAKAKDLEKALAEQISDASRRAAELEVVRAARADLLRAAGGVVEAAAAAPRRRGRRRGSGGRPPGGAAAHPARAGRGARRPQRLRAAARGAGGRAGADRGGGRARHRRRRARHLPGALRRLAPALPGDAAASRGRRRAGGVGDRGLRLAAHRRGVGGGGALALDGPAGAGHRPAGADGRLP